MLEPAEQKVLLALTTCRKYQYAPGDQVAHKNGFQTQRSEAVYETWYQTWEQKFQDKVDFKFFVGQGPEQVNLPNLVELDAPDGYYDLPAKVKSIFKWAVDRNYTHVVKIDDDVVMRISNFLKFFQPVDYCGYELESNTSKWASGAAYVISRRAMQLIVDTPWDPTWNSAEDQATGRILAANGIPLVHDPRYLCCSCPECFRRYGLENLITIHTTKPEMMYELHTKLAG
jgi:hypothetical protein